MSESPSSPEITTWQRVTAARAEVRTAERAAQDNFAPFGFATRVVAHYRALDRSQRFAFWRTWSVRAMFAALAVVAVLALSQRSQPAVASPGGSLPVPTIPIPLP
jgi:hypothetical protein